MKVDDYEKGLSEVVVVVVVVEWRTGTLLEHSSLAVFFRHQILIELLDAHQHEWGRR